MGLGLQPLQLVVFSSSSSSGSAWGSWCFLRRCCWTAWATYYSASTCCLAASVAFFSFFSSWWLWRVSRSFRIDARGGRLGSSSFFGSQFVSRISGPNASPQRPHKQCLSLSALDLVYEKDIFAPPFKCRGHGSWICFEPDWA